MTWNVAGPYVKTIGCVRRGVNTYWILNPGLLGSSLAKEICLWLLQHVLIISVTPALCQND